MKYVLTDIPPTPGYVAVNAQQQQLVGLDNN